jgi:hypothetical protein
MSLTKPEDIFPAIFGLAKSVQKVTDWEYIAGLWKENLIVDLVWYTKNPRLVSRRVPWRAPTFSWASVVSTGSGNNTSSISYGYMDILRQGLEGHTDDRRITNIYATLITTSCTPVRKDDPTGRLQSGYIILKGTVIKAIICRPTPHSKRFIAAIGRGPYPQDSLSMDFDVDGDGDAVAGFVGRDAVRCLRLIGTTKRAEFEIESFWYTWC